MKLSSFLYYFLPLLCLLLVALVDASLGKTKSFVFPSSQEHSAAEDISLSHNEHLKGNFPLRSLVEKMSAKYHLTEQMNIKNAVSFAKSVLVTVQEKKRDNRRALQFDNIGVDDIPDELFNFILGKCGVQIAALNFSDPEVEPLVNVILCVKSAMIQLVDPCFEKFPGVWDPTHCVAETLLTEQFLTATVTFFLTFDFGTITDPESFVQLLGELFPVDNIESAFTPIEGLNASGCLSLFGSVQSPQFISCLSLFDASDLTPFLQALSIGFNGINTCIPFRTTFGIVGTDFVDFEDLEYEIGLDLSEIDENELEAEFQVFNANFDTCSTFDGGALEASLDSKFETPESKPNSANRAFNGILTLAVTLAAALKLFA